MKQSSVIVLAVWLTASAHAGEHTVTWTGWFSDAHCAASRAAGGLFTATNPDCSKRCIDQGAAPVFLSEQAKAIFQVKGYAQLVDDLGYHVEVQGVLDEAGHSITIQKVTRLGWDGAACARPRKPAAKQ
jgi:hypothetical protein